MSSRTLKSVERAIDVLDCLSGDSPWMGLTEISRQLGISKSGAHRLLASLEDKGMVQQDPVSRRYGLGPKVLALASGFLKRIDLSAECRPHMRRLRDVTGETVILQVVQGFQRVCVDEVPSTQPVRWTMDPGTAVPLHAGAASKVILAFMPPEEVEHIIREVGLPPVTPHTIVDPDRLRAELAVIREEGVAISVEEAGVGAAAIAAPIFDHVGRVVAALSIAGPSARWTPERMRQFAEPLKEAVRQISAAMGSSP